MAEHETSSAAAAELLARLYGKGYSASAPRFHGGGPAVESRNDWLLFTALTDYLERNPLERHRLSDELRATIKVPSGYPTNAPVLAGMLPNYWPQGSHSTVAQLHSNFDYDRQVAICDFAQLDAYRSDVASLARFSQRVDHATFYLFVAVDRRIDSHQWRKPGVKIRKAPKSLYGALAQECFARWHSARELIMFDWSLSETAERLYRTAFWSLCELTPADTQLKGLFEHDRYRACRELVRHVDAYADQLALATNLAEWIDEDAKAEVKAADKARLNDVQEALLERAGQRLTLTEAAERLGMTRQAVHKKIKTGSALGLMIGETLVLPSAQLVESHGGTSVVAHLKDLLTLFSRAGAGTWSALQYLIDPDPALGGTTPLDRLKAGDVVAVIAAARAYLGQDEG